jgi:hypothetical protein
MRGILFPIGLVFLVIVALQTVRWLVTQPWLLIFLAIGMIILLLSEK